MKYSSSTGLDVAARASRAVVARTPEDTEIAGAPSPARAHRVLQLQRAMGNRAVSRALSAGVEPGRRGLSRAPGGAGKRLPPAVQDAMASAFGADFSAVRIHEGAHVGALGARAFTTGRDIHFAPGEYQPTTARGKGLLGHELTHVLQQRAGRVEAPLQARGPAIAQEPRLEREADDLGDRAARGEPVRRPALASGSPRGADTSAPIQAKLKVGAKLIDRQNPEYSDTKLRMKEPWDFQFASQVEDKATWEYDDWAEFDTRVQNLQQPNVELKDWRPLNKGVLMESTVKLAANTTYLMGEVHGRGNYVTFASRLFPTDILHEGHHVTKSLDANQQQHGLDHHVLQGITILTFAGLEIAETKELVGECAEAMKSGLGLQPVKDAWEFYLAHTNDTADVLTCICKAIGVLNKEMQGYWEGVPNNLGNNPFRDLRDLATNLQKSKLLGDIQDVTDKKEWDRVHRRVMESRDVHFANQIVQRAGRPLLVIMGHYHVPGTVEALEKSGKLAGNLKVFEGPDGDTHFIESITVPAPNGDTNDVFSALPAGWLKPAQKLEEVSDKVYDASAFSLAKPSESAKKKSRKGKKNNQDNVKDDE